MESGQHTQRQSGPADLDGVRAGLRTMWGSVAPGWEEHADFVDGRSAGMTEVMLAAAEIEPGDHVLELACGPGGLGLEAAGRVGPDGKVVLSDVAPQMIAIAARRAEARGLTNVTTLELELERIDQPDESYDVVLAREGIMLVPEPRQAAAEIRRVLSPGGRAVVSVWGPRERNPWLGVLFDALSEQLGVPFPPPGLPGPLALDSVDKLISVLTDGGFGMAEVEELEVPWKGDSLDEWWRTTLALAGPVANLLAAQPDEVVDAIKGRAYGALREYDSGEAVEIPGVSLVGTVRR